MTHQIFDQIRVVRRKCLKMCPIDISPADLVPLYDHARYKPLFHTTQKFCITDLPFVHPRLIEQIKEQNHDKNDDQP